MDTATKLDFIDASHSWHGYTYQGKIALLVALQTINSLYANKSPLDINDYYLELEWLEDFSIIKKENDNYYYESIHQVKAKANTSLNDYADALETLARKLQKRKKIKSAYLHVERPLSYTLSWQDSIKEIVMSQKYTKKDLDKIQASIDNPDERKKLLDQYSQNHIGRKSDLSKKLSQFYQNSINNKNIINALTLYRDEIEKSIRVLRESFNDSILSKIQLYTYNIEDSNTPYCAPNKLEDLLINEILTYYEQTKSISSAIKDTEFAKVAYIYLLGFIDDYIILRHMKKVPHNFCFSNLINILNNDKMNGRNRLFYLYHLKEAFFEFYQEYCDNCEGKTNNTKCDVCSIEQTSEKVSQFSQDEFEKFLYATFPHINKALVDEKSYRAFNYMAQGYNSPFLKILEDSTLIYENDRIPITFLLKRDNEKKELHLLSAIKKEAGKRKDEIFCRDIIENENANQILYDYDVIIAHGIEAKTVASGAGDLWNDFQSSDHIYYLKDVRIENIDKYLKE